MARHFLSIRDYSWQWIEHIFELSTELKNKLKNGKLEQPLRGKTLGMIFAKPSVRTRISFEVGMQQLGGMALYLAADDIQIGSREPISDITRVLSRYVDGIMARLFAHKDIEELARYSSVPVINGLTDLLHPCQVMADLFTIFEYFGKRRDMKIAFIGDGNNVLNSWLHMASLFPMNLTMSVPEGYEPDKDILQYSREAGLSEITIQRDPMAAAENADVLYTDVWTSMGDYNETDKRQKDFKDYQINAKVLSQAKQKCLVMHCLPAHRGEEITDEVIEGPNSVVFDEAENRLHVQNAILVNLMKPEQ